jgi:proline racemase/trans-L-3-hydroxyproline dehydratase
MAEFIHIIPAVDVHTAGEPARIVLSGLPPVPGATMADKKRHLVHHLDHIRTLLLHEPRGHRDMFGVILVAPTTDQADYGILFMDSAGYIDMCGHSVMGAATALMEMGIVAIREPGTKIVFDTPAGLVESNARVVGSRVVEVSISNVPCFLYQREVEIDIQDLGNVRIDVSFGGNFFAMAPADRLGVSVHPDNYAKLISLGMAIKEAVNKKIKVQHPTKRHIAKIELTEIYERPLPSTPFAKSVVIFGQGQLDRSPCGTGTSAAMATLYSNGELPLGVEFVNESIIGTRFKGKLVKETRVGDFVAVTPIVTGKSYIIGIQQFVVDPNDPLKYGFIIGS